MKQQQSKTSSPNPNGKKGDPISLAPHTFDDALRKILASPPEPKAEKKPVKKSRTKTK